MANLELVTAGDVELMQGLAQRVTALRPDLIGGGASYGELAWVWRPAGGRLRPDLPAAPVVLRRGSGGVGVGVPPAPGAAE